PRGFHIPRGISTSWKEIINILIKFENQLFFYQVTFYLYTRQGQIAFFFSPTRNCIPRDPIGQHLAVSVHWAGQEPALGRTGTGTGQEPALGRNRHWAGQEPA
ncbi:MAG: hypothetical protein LBQ12_15325, partial [Deltaproteobacteria bacterium]|nr:hypothetical protein [Deltaproteobacteria bacterium]